MLNDLSRQTRLSLFVQMLGAGLMFGAIFAVGASIPLALGLLCVGAVVTLGWVVAHVAWTRRAERSARALYARAGEEIVTGQARGVPAVGRVVRRRVALRSPAFLAGTPHPVEGPAMLLAVTVLADGGARRVGALAPARLGLEARRAPVALLLHPDEREAAVLDPHVTPERLAAIAADPRWQTERLPTDRTVVGGWGPLVGCALAGVVIGLGFDALVVALAT